MCVGVSHATHGPRDRARPRGRGRRRPLGDAGAAAPRPRHRRRPAEALPRGGGGGRPADRGPGPPGQLRGPDDVRLPAGAGRGVAAVPRRSSWRRSRRRRRRAAWSRARPTCACWAGSAARCCSRSCGAGQPRDDDRVRVPGGAGGRGAPLVRGDAAGRPPIFDRYATLDPVREPGAAQPADPQAGLPAARRDRPRHGAGARRRRPMPGRSRTSTTCCGGPGSTRTWRRVRCCRRCWPDPRRGTGSRERASRDGEPSRDSPVTAAPGSSPRPPARSRR